SANGENSVTRDLQFQNEKHNRKKNKKCTDVVDGENLSGKETKGDADDSYDSWKDCARVIKFHNDTNHSDGEKKNGNVRISKKRKKSLTPRHGNFNHFRLIQAHLFC